MSQENGVASAAANPAVATVRRRRRYGTRVIMTAVAIGAAWAWCRFR